MSQDFRPYVTWGYLIANLAVFLRFDLGSPTDASLSTAGALIPSLAATGEPWRLLTCNLVHIGLLHLIMNSYALFLLGPRLEAVLGARRYLVLLLASGLSGSAFAGILLPPGAMLGGASAAVFGLLGGLMAFGIREGRGVLNFLNSPGGQQILIILLINFGIGLLPGSPISNEAHLGGLVVGMICCLQGFRLSKVKPKLQHQLAFGALVLGLIVSVLHPVHASWFQLRRAWHDEGPRQDRLFVALADRGDASQQYFVKQHIKLRYPELVPERLERIFSWGSQGLRFRLTHEWGWTEEAFDRIHKTLESDSGVAPPDLDPWGR